MMPAVNSTTQTGLLLCSTQPEQLYGVALVGKVEPGFQTIRKDCFSTSVERFGPVTWFDPLPELRNGLEPLQSSKLWLTVLSWADPHLCAIP